MAGDWLEVEKDTPEKPELFAMAAALGVSQGDVFLACFKLWRWADSHTVDGTVPRLSFAVLDDIVSLPGFARALLDVGWLHARSGSLQLPNFDRHMGQSAKRRIADAERQRKYRGRKGVKDPVTKPSRGKCDNPVTTEEKRTEQEGATAPSSAASAANGEGEPKKEPKSKAKPRKRDDLFDAVAEVTGADPKASGAHVGRVCKALKAADPPYTPEEVRRLPGILQARGFQLPLSLGTVEKYIGWTRTEVTTNGHARPGGGVGSGARVRAAANPYAGLAPDFGGPAAAPAGADGGPPGDRPAADRRHPAGPA